MPGTIVQSKVVTLGGETEFWVLLFFLFCVIIESLHIYEISFMQNYQIFFKILKSRGRELPFKERHQKCWYTATTGFSYCHLWDPFVVGYLNMLMIPQYYIIN